MFSTTNSRKQPKMLSNNLLRVRKLRKSLKSNGWLTKMCCLIFHRPLEGLKFLKNNHFGKSLTLCTKNKLQT